MRRPKNRAVGTLHLRNRTIHRRIELFLCRKSRNSRHPRCSKCANKPKNRLCSVCQAAHQLHRKQQQKQQQEQLPLLRKTRSQWLHDAVPSSSIHVLPEHLQQRILEYLPLKERIRNELVCKRWLRLLRPLWITKQDLHIPHFAHDEFNIRQVEEQHVCGMLRKCGRYLQKVAFFFLREKMGMAVLESMGERCINLRQLFLSTDVPCLTMYHLLKCVSMRFPTLQLLNISYHLEQVQSDHCQRNFENGVRACMRRFRQLRGFYLCTFVMPSNPSSLFPESPVLETYGLMMLQVRNATVEQGRFVRAAYVLQLFKHLANHYPHLHELSLSLDADYQVDENELLLLLQRLGSEKRIRKLNLRLTYEQFNIWFGVHALRGLAHFCALEELTLLACQLPPDFAELLDQSGTAARIRRLTLDTVYMFDALCLFSLFAACCRLQHFALKYRHAEHFPSPSDITAQVIAGLFFHSSYTLQQLELVDCDYVDLSELITCMHMYMHYKGTDNPPARISNTSPFVHLSFVCRHRYRLRQLALLPRCCLQIRRLHEDVYRVSMPRCCRSHPPVGGTVDEESHR